VVTPKGLPLKHRKTTRNQPFSSRAFACDQSQNTRYPDTGNPAQAGFLYVPDWPETVIPVSPAKRSKSSGVT
jgi:hypothetical protein